MNYLTEGQINVTNFDNLTLTGTYVFTEATLTSGFAFFSYVPEDAAASSSHYYIPAGNNGSLVITDVNTTDSTVTGTFQLTAYDDNFTPYDTISVTNGEFFLPY
ncbi:MAG: hypothetical protein LRY27_00410 [Chitinophagales bacterium]|nr:hypothetical protein [Chitinophagales bacterium]